MPARKPETFSSSRAHCEVRDTATSIRNAVADTWCGQFLSWHRHDLHVSRAMSQHIVESLAMLEALKLDLAKYEQTVVRSAIDPLLTATVPPDSIHKIVDQVEKLGLPVSELRFPMRAHLTTAKVVNPAMAPL
jgi:hypothetical protein